jgi:hypothetical protein
MENVIENYYGTFINLTTGHKNVKKAPKGIRGFK